MPDRDALIRAARFVHMPSNDVQRVLRGVVLVLQAAARAKVRSVPLPPRVRPDSAPALPAVNDDQPESPTRRSPRRRRTLSARATTSPTSRASYRARCRASLLPVRPPMTSAITRSSSRKLTPATA